jgi:hypothetical protein
MVAKSKSPKSQSTALVNYDEEMRKEANEIAKAIGSVSGRSISTKKQVFTLPDGRAHKGPLSVVVLDFINKNLMYDRAWREGERIPPLCFAIGKNIEELAPSVNAPDPQAEQCRGCPMNEFGTASNGGGKACKNTAVLALASPDAKSKEIMLLSVSPTGLTNWNKYVTSVKAQFNAVPIKVVTEITFDENVDFPKLQFSVAAPNENLQTHWGMREEARLLLSQEPDLSAPVEAKSARRPAPAARKPAAPAKRATAGTRR